MVAPRIDPIDFVLALVGYSKKVEGRTFLQKLAYFVNDKVKLELPFRPYYYGPYSEDIAAATQTLVSIGFLEERADVFPPASSDVFERRRYTYSLTKDGESVLAQLKKELPILAAVEKATRTIMGAKDCNYECLSIAAKTHHILKAKGGSMKGSEIMEVARELGWNFDDKDLQEAASFLKELELVKDAD